MISGEGARLFSMNCKTNLVVNLDGTFLGFEKCSGVKAKKMLFLIFKAST